MAFFEIKLEENGRLQLALNEMARVGSDRHYPTIGQLLLGAVEDVVEMEGPGWPPLAEATLAQRRKQGRGAKMLQDTGVMMGSLSPGWGPSHVEVTFGVPYAIAHIEGIGVPQRNPFDLAPVEDALYEDIEETIMGDL